MRSRGSLAQQGVDAVGVLGGDRVPDAPAVGLADDDAVVVQRLHVVADGRLSQLERLGEPADQRTPVVGLADEPQDARTRRITERGEVSSVGDRSIDVSLSPRTARLDAQRRSRTHARCAAR